MMMLGEQGADLCARDKRGRTPLHYAAFTGKTVFAIGNDACFLWSSYDGWLGRITGKYFSKLGKIVEMQLRSELQEVLKFDWSSFFKIILCLAGKET